MFFQNGYVIQIDWYIETIRLQEFEKNCLYVEHRKFDSIYNILYIVWELWKYLKYK